MNESRKTTMSKDFDRWKFIEEWLPGYTCDQDVAWSNDLSKYIEGEFNYQDEYDRDRINEIAEVCPNLEDAELEQKRVDCELFLAALEAYKKAKAEGDEK